MEQRRINLTRTEFALLEMLIANPRRVTTRNILEEVQVRLSHLGQRAGSLRQVSTLQDRVTASG